ncbi:permease-like cell division protein FtsX [Actinoplanes sp. NPDC023801]|uniref:permease-like cell division protein FtsX n=1 Tax=Actinoplanes sp. NPDC023801 TaxID=3154595 RepID=UPI00340DF63D
MTTSEQLEESTPDSPQTPAPAAGRPAWRRRIVPAATVVLAMLIGAAAAFGIFQVVGFPGRPEHRFTVNIYFDAEATAEQKAAVEAKLPLFEPVGEVTFESKDEAFREYQELRKINPNVPEVTDAATLPDSFRMETEGYLFDCTGYTEVRHMPGVRKVQVLQDLVNDYAAQITCSAEYARP